MTDRQPRMSVILLAGPMRARAARMLHSVLDQSNIDEIEVLLYDCQPADVPPLPRSDHPAVRSFRPAMDEPFGKIRADGVRAARAPVVAFIEEHALAQPGWAEALLKAHEGPWAGVGSAIHIGNRGIGVADAVMLFNFGMALPPAQRGETPGMPGHNSSYKRDILLQYDDVLDRLLLAEITLQWKLQADGHRLYLEPDSRITHFNETRFSSVARGFFIINRCLAHVRADIFGWSFWQRLRRILLAPANPWVRIARQAQHYRRQRPDYWQQFVRNLPMILATEHIAVAGHTYGLIFGMKRADVAYRIYELSEPRDEPGGGLP